MNDLSCFLLLIINRLPYHPIIEDLRSEELLAYLKNKITTITNNPIEANTIDLKNQLNRQWIFKDELVMKALSKQRLFKSTLDVAVSQLPIISNLYSAVDFHRNVLSYTNERRSNARIGFTVKAKAAISKINNI